MGATAVMPGSSPDATMIQPIAGLQPAERANPQEGNGQPPADRAPNPEPHQRQEEHEADEPPELAVAPFPRVDELELGERHALVQEFVLGNLPVLLELRQPRGLG